MGKLVQKKRMNTYKTKPVIKLVGEKLNRAVENRELSRRK